MKTFPTGSTDPIQVLVVDDVPGAAETYARLISAKTALVVAATLDPTEALKIVRENPVLVAVLDQVMEPTSGTELFEQIRALDPRVGAVMLSGEANLGDAAVATRLNYEDILSKTQVDELPSVVRNIYFRRLASLAADGPDSVVELVPFRRRLGLFSRPAVRLALWSLLEADHIEDEDWTTFLQVSAGQQVAEQVVLQTRKRYELTRGSRSSLKANFGGRFLKSLEASIETDLGQEVAETTEREIELTKTVSMTYELPQPQDVNVPHVRARNYQYAPVSNLVRAVLQVQCRQCGGTSTHVINLRVATGHYATRHVDVLHDGQTKIVPTGTRL